VIASGFGDLYRDTFDLLLWANSYNGFEGSSVEVDLVRNGSVGFVALSKSLDCVAFVDIVFLG
jgi:hypothetical protein